MQYSEKRYRLKGITPLLGSVSLDKEIYTQYIATKGKTEEEKRRGIEDANNVTREEEKVTGFYRDVDTDNILLKGYQIKGFMKEAAKALKDQLGLTAHVSKIDNLVFIKERDIPIMRDGAWIEKPDGFLERPLRGETAQGPRVSLAKSEMINEGWYVDITVQVLENKKTAKSAEMSLDIIDELFAYGSLKGLLQWRNGGYGSFLVEELEEEND